MYPSPTLNAYVESQQPLQSQEAAISEKLRVYICFLNFPAKHYLTCLKVVQDHESSIVRAVLFWLPPHLIRAKVASSLNLTVILVYGSKSTLKILDA